MPVCDICSRTIPEGFKQISGSEVSRATAGGYLPQRWMLLSMFGSAAPAHWANLVEMSRNGNWGLCDECFEEFQAGRKSGFRRPTTTEQGQSVPASPASPESLRCSRCNSELKFLGGLGDMFPNATIIGSPGGVKSQEQWNGTVCVKCGAVFCPTCLDATQSVPCPECGEGTKPAMRHFLDQAPKARAKKPDAMRTSSSASGSARKSPNAGCFIATACYGSAGAEEVIRLRRFRDERLLPTLLGRAFVAVYYLVSPHLAAWLAHHPNLAATIRRWLLDPLVSILFNHRPTEHANHEGMDDHAKRDSSTPSPEM